MALTNVFLILSEPNFEQRVEDRSQYASGNYGTNCYNLPGAIEVLKFGFEISQVGSEPPGRPRSIEKVDRTDVKIVKAVDSRSPLLFRYCCEGTFIGAAEIQCYGPVPTQPYLVYRLQHVHVSSYSPSGGDDVPMEEIGLRFGEMGVLWDEGGLGVAQHGNSKTGRLGSNWSWVAEWPITLGDPIQRIIGMRGEEHPNPAGLS
ncbi:MAG: type VI secretion system tube protein Hcp [Planctomycetales bacterium]|nr:type VI secretion system tube protein Hcp [Planctomycetales bacterium]